MTDDALIEEIAERLRGLPMLTAPDGIRERVRERIAEEEARPISESVRERLASLPTLPAPPELDTQLHPIQWSWSRRRRRRLALPWVPRWNVAPRRRIPLAIATAAVCGTALGFVALHLVSSNEPRAVAFPAGMHAETTKYAPAYFEPQPHLRPRPRRGPHLSMRVRVDSLGVPVWYAAAYTTSGHAVKPKCSSPDGATPVGAPTATLAGPANPSAPAYSGGATLTCSADVGSAGPPITATLRVPDGGGGTTSSSSTGTSTGTTAGSTTGTSTSQAPPPSSSTATSDGTTSP
jgi:hypothetical protein